MGIDPKAVCIQPVYKVAGDKGIYETKSKQQSPWPRPVKSWGNVCWSINF